MKKGAVQPRGFHGMVYGEPGIGKTTLLSQLPKPAALIDVEGGAGWLYSKRDLAGLTVYRIDDTDNPADEIEKFLREAVTGKGEAAQFKGIGIDSLSALRSRHLTSLTGGSLHIEQGDYGKATTWLRRVLTLTQFAPQVILWTSHLAEDSDGPRKFLRPSGMSQTALDHCVELLDAIIFMGSVVEEGSSSVVLSTETADPVNGRSTILTKDRTGLLPSVMTFPGLDDAGEPPLMFAPYFEEVLKELQIDSSAKSAKSASKPKPTKKGK